MQMFFFCFLPKQIINAACVDPEIFLGGEGGGEWGRGVQLQDRVGETKFYQLKSHSMES